MCSDLDLNYSDLDLDLDLDLDPLNLDLTEFYNYHTLLYTFGHLMNVSSDLDLPDLDLSDLDII